MLAKDDEATAGVDAVRGLHGAPHEPRCARKRVRVDIGAGPQDGSAADGHQGQHELDRDRRRGEGAGQRKREAVTALAAGVLLGPGVDDGARHLERSGRPFQEPALRPRGLEQRHRKAERDRDRDAGAAASRPDVDGLGRPQLAESAAASSAPSTSTCQAASGSRTAVTDVGSATTRSR